MLLGSIFSGRVEDFDLPEVISKFSVGIGSGKASALLGGEGVLLFLPGFTVATSVTILSLGSGINRYCHSLIV